MSNKLECTIHKVLKQESGTGSKGVWHKQIFVVKTKGQYPKEVAIEAWNDKCDLIPNPGTDCTVFYEPESREYQGKYYTTLKLWKFEFGGAKAPVQEEAKAKNVSSEDEDLPF